MDFTLVVLQGRSATNTIKLNDGVTIVGRHNDCQLRIKSSQVSRKHCELFEKKGLLLVKDLNSSNGTIVNGKRIQGQRVLEAGDELSIGPIVLRVAKVGAGAGAAEPGKAPVKASDTAVTEAIAIGVDEVDADEFTVDIDEPTQGGAAVAVSAPAPAPAAAAPSPRTKAPAPADDDFADFLLDVPVAEDEVVEDTETTQAVPLAAAAPEPEPNPHAKAAPEAAEKPAPKHEPAPAPGESDDAIADFLLDIKLDEEE
jgi:pSer/pThr/pTyr-binding forkhead associated (FHA) protein